MSPRFFKWSLVSTFLYCNYKTFYCQPLKTVKPKWWWFSCLCHYLVSFFKLAHNSPVHETFFRQYHPFRHAWRSFVAQIPCPQSGDFGQRWALYCKLLWRWCNNLYTNGPLERHCLLRFYKTSFLQVALGQKPCIAQYDDVWCRHLLLGCQIYIFQSTPLASKS